MSHRWKRLGVAYAPDGSAWWARQHAMLPTPLMLDDHRLRVYFASTDENTVGRIGFAELDVREPTRVLTSAKEPVLDIGRPGAFDDNGVNPCCVVKVGDELRMYYVGYQLHRKVPYTLFSGCAVSRDGGLHFERVSEVPILDRCDGELFFRTAPFVRRDGQGWRMWYIAGTGFAEAAGRTQPIYGLRTITSTDGIHFPGPGRELMAPRQPEEIGFGRPFLVSRGTTEQLFYSIRSPTEYRLGYAESADGLEWSRRDDASELTGTREAWESQMTCYSAVVETKHGTFMLYNGNGYGRTGFGIAALVS